jgi:tetratricopeptide (TPR) repeat protein
VPGDGDAIPALTGWGNYRWKVSTPSDSAQFYFNQGMAMYYAFHIVESRASFDKATRFDSTFAMAWWGKALAFGPNINDFGYQPPSEAYPSARNAVRLKARCTPVEKALIDAIAVRYSADTAAKQAALNEKYRDAMSAVFQQFPQHADVATLYADALMLLHPWDLYHHDFSPKSWTPKIVATIKNALRLSPRHPGANHYLIHAVEASARPGDALKSAAFLATAMPSVSHITHMPSHVYIRTGYYEKGMELNTQAVEGFKKYTAAFAPVTEGAFLYSLHNLHMKMACAHMAGNYSEALSAAKELQQQIPADYVNLPNAMGNYLQYVHQSPLLTYIRFGKWEEVLQEKTGGDLPYGKVLQHFGRGLAYARLGRLTEAASEAALMTTAMQQQGLKEPFSPFNSAYDGAVVARHILDGTIALQQQNLAEAIGHYQQAANAEDRLIYDEPRDWLLPARHYLGDALLQAGRNEEALAVLQKDLQINPANGWALIGLQLAFEQLNRTGAIITTKQRLKNAWLVKDVDIKRPVF